ncbi:hypothetical protein C8R43DRAFT_1031261 [Mycena crocata]|nr:hypothetical protein C8R43DRAFT_1031261 [Mycena crocata]
MLRLLTLLISPRLPLLRIRAFLPNSDGRVSATLKVVDLYSVPADALLMTGYQQSRASLSNSGVIFFAKSLVARISVLSRFESAAFRKFLR